MAEEKREGSEHFILVHGACHGAWTWYKAAALLQQAGHRVTAIDLGASGHRDEKLFELKGYTDYVKPLMEVMEALPDTEKVVLVGHSFGGVSLAWATEAFPNKVSVAVYVTAFMPDCSHCPYYTVEQYFIEFPRAEFLLDSQIGYECEVKELVPTLLFGPMALKCNLYQNCSLEDLILGKSLMKPTSLFIDNLSNAPKFSQEKYGSVARVFILCKEDRVIPELYQRWIIKNFPPKEVKEISKSDHMPMLSTPNELVDHLVAIASSYSLSPKKQSSTAT